MAGLRKYNDLCATLAAMYDPMWAVPLPKALPTELKLLRESASLMQDVWISRPMEEVPLWLQDSSVHEGIWAMLKVDRCLEEHRRLELEAGNLSRWLVRELAAVEVALNEPCNASLQVPLQQRHTHLLSLKSRWSNPLLPQRLLEQCIQDANRIAWTLRTAAFSSNLSSSAFKPPEQREYIEDEGDEDGLQDATAEAVEDTGPECTEDLLIGDYWLQEAEQLSDDDLNPDALSPGVDVALVWQLPVNLRLHQSLLEDLRFQPMEEFRPLSEPRYFPYLRGRFIFTPRELGMMNSPSARLNDVCINGIEHWVMATLISSSGEIHLFDSFGNRDAWEAEVK
ncbi:hypothetical protein DXG01_010871, partial [Tephrocybe rancida]